MMEFIFAHLWTIIGAVGGLGTAVAIAALIFFGVPLAAVVASGLGLASKLVDFLKTPVGQAIAVILLIWLALFIGDAHGHRQEMKLSAEKVAARDVYWKAQIKKAADDFKTARTDRDNLVDGKIEKLVNARLLEIKAQEQAIAAMGTKHEVHPASDPCVLTPADIDAGSVRKRSKRTAGAATSSGAAR